MKMTPKMTIDSMRLLKKHPEVFEADDDDDTKTSMQGVAAMYLAAQAAGKVEDGQDFPTWYATADITDLDEEDEEQADADPTASKRR